MISFIVLSFIVFLVLTFLKIRTFFKAKKTNLKQKNIILKGVKQNKLVFFLHLFLVISLVLEVLQLFFTSKKLEYLFLCFCFLALISSSVFFARRFFCKIKRFSSSELNTKQKLDAAIILVLEFFIALNIILYYFLNNDIFYKTSIILICFFLVYIPFSKHLHIILSPIFIALYGNKRDLLLKNINLEDTKLGAEKAFELNKIDVLGALSCTECGRCTQNCPVNNAGFTLSPKNIISEIKNSIANKKNIEISDENLFSCLSCRTCYRICPIGIDALSAILQIRRFRTLEEGKLPLSLAQTALRVQKTENSWAIKKNAATAENKSSQKTLLLWGEKTFFDSKYNNCQNALRIILNKGKINFFESCEFEINLGELQKNLGDEFTAQMQEKKFLTLIEKNKIETIITSSPHVFQRLNSIVSIKNLNLTILFHAQLILNLLKEQKISIKIPLELKYSGIKIFEPCYISKFGAEKNLLKEIFSYLKIKHSNLDVNCCGSPVAEFFSEKNELFNKIKEQNDKKTGNNTLITACPNCFSMLTNAEDVSIFIWKNLI